MSPTRSRDVVRPPFPLTRLFRGRAPPCRANRSLGRGLEPAFAHDVGQRLDEFRLRFPTLRPRVMELAKAAETDRVFRRLIDDDRMDKPGCGAIHVAQSFQSAVPFANEN